MIYLPDEECQSHMQAVKEFATQAGLENQLSEVLDYLGNYATGPGCMYDQAQGGDTRCCLYPDSHAPHSFEYRMECRKSARDLWQKFFVGGLVYQSPEIPANGSFPSLTVSLHDRHGWFSHT